MRQPLDFFFAVFFAEGRRRLWPSSLSNAADEENLGTPPPSNGEAATSSPQSSPCLRSRSEPYSDTEIKVHFSMSLVLIP
ncbi:hypothetical protein BHE74_00020549 [Ensete ventricosum]|nr:hypothetical protein BHE74_00020549 [Ensete ventricosum]